jgi:hypothetical protein
VRSSGDLASGSGGEVWQNVMPHKHQTPRSAFLVPASLDLDRRVISSRETNDHGRADSREVETDVSGLLR